MDELPLAVHRFTAPYGRPGWAPPHPVNPLRGFSSQPLSTKRNNRHKGGFSVLVEVVGIDSGHPWPSPCGRTSCVQIGFPADL